MEAKKIIKILVGEGLIDVNAVTNYDIAKRISNREGGITAEVMRIAEDTGYNERSIWRIWKKWKMAVLLAKMGKP